VSQAGASIFKGDTGEIALFLSGLGVFSFADKHLKNHYVLLIPLSLLWAMQMGF
jgi:hypothetical protein